MTTKGTTDMTTGCTNCIEIKGQLDLLNRELRASLDREQRVIRERQELEGMLGAVRRAVTPTDDDPACAGLNHDPTPRGGT